MTKKIGRPSKGPYKRISLRLPAKDAARLKELQKKLNKTQVALIGDGIWRITT